MTVEELFGPAFVVTWFLQGVPHWIDFDDRDTALSFSLLAKECGRENVSVARGPVAEIPEGAKERIWQGIAMRLAEEKACLRLQVRDAEKDLEWYRGLVDAGALKEATT